MPQRLTGQVVLVNKNQVYDGPDNLSGRAYRLRQHPDNQPQTVVYFGRDGNGTVTPQTGYPLMKDECVEVNFCNYADSTLEALKWVANKDNARVCWMRLA